MGTRSRIGIMHGDNCKSVYCHWDGYLEHNGAILQAHYDSTKANFLVAQGDLSSLGRIIGEQHPFSKYELEKDSPDFDKLIALHEQAEAEGWCTFYGRDRGETGTEFKTDSTFEAFFERVENCGGEWYYIMKDGAWYVGNTYERDVVYYKKLVPLSEAMLALLKESAEESV
jgi:hypothetical protein